jgi:hypothetical protein
MSKTKTNNLRFLTLLLTVGLSAVGANAADLKVPATLAAGSGLSIPTSGSGDTNL